MYKSGVQIPIPLDEIVLGHNSRWQGVDQSKAEEYAASFESVGQLQACIVRQLPGGNVELIVGFTRHAAALIYNERHPDKPMRLKAVVVNCNEEEALQKNVVENNMRSDPSPMDHAFAQRRFREEFQWPDAKIAEFYHYSPSRVSQLKKFLSLSKPIQLQIHSRELSFQAALELCGMDAPDDTLAEVAKDAENDAKPSSEAPASSNGHQKRKKTKSQRVLEKVREKKIASGGAVPRTLANIRADLAEWAGSLDGERSDLCRALLKYVNGGLRAETMKKKIGEMS